jgi:hypothetical protein
MAKKKSKSWKCVSCKIYNSPKSTECKICKLKKQGVPGDWNCSGCESFNPASDKVCSKCETKKTPEMILQKKAAFGD